MNKKELVNHIAEAAGITKTDADSALQAFMTGVTETMKKGDKLSLTGFGTFSVNDRPARTGRNPQTGKALEIPAKKVVKFKVGKHLDDSVN